MNRPFGCDSHSAVCVPSPNARRAIRTTSRARSSAVDSVAGSQMGAMPRVSTARSEARCLECAQTPVTAVTGLPDAERGPRRRLRLGKTDASKLNAGLTRRLRLMRTLVLGVLLLHAIARCGGRSSVRPDARSRPPRARVRRRSRRRWRRRRAARRTARVRCGGARLHASAS